MIDFLHLSCELASLAHKSFVALFDLLFISTNLLRLFLAEASKLRDFLFELLQRKTADFELRLKLIVTRLQLSLLNLDTLKLCFYLFLFLALYLDSF